MPRPTKGRKVCCLPGSNLFGPLKPGLTQPDILVMSVDEYETIRLIDLQGFTQEQCANQMQIARTTAQRIYNKAREKLAQSLVNGKLLKIEGGDYKLCNGQENTCACGGCRRHRCSSAFADDGSCRDRE
ncbi:UPF0251 protein [Syntrophobotulus glycolicus DSM 8271]|uniref:UPF0251 protein Sgly_1423 n=1 Tax=Syntrophobotulus glycolicus (strain DSM 8271 / FlGlyR) TaxID=645991 RepID=F0SWG0_SYNGF|nr:DUF134 domain-containing protein [Syntrophobotulus glycolicus]ADY55726.1 UPF0251 protein [Syntrophobotulus glycolicus DSM 8271]